MVTGAHLLISWLSTVEVLKERRERVLVTLSGIAPDLDGAGIIVDTITETTDYYFKYHHYLGHSIFSAFFFATIAATLAKTQKSIVWLMSFLLVHVHILCDVIGSKGPDGYQWPIYYFYPLNSKYELTWTHQWELDAWQNQVTMGVLFSISLYYAAKKKMTFLEVFSQRLDKEAFVIYNKYIRKRLN